MMTNYTTRGDKLRSFIKKSRACLCEIGILLIIFTFFMCTNASAATVTKIKYVEKDWLLKIVLDVNGPVKYKVNKGNSYTVISIPGLEWAASAPKSIPTKILESLGIVDVNGTCEMSAQFRYLTKSSIYPLKNPNRLVIEFRKLSKMTIPKLNVPEIEKVTVKSLPEKFKITVNLSSFVPYVVTTLESGLMIELPNTNSIIKSRKILTKDKLIPKVGIDQAGTTTLISIFQTYPSFYQIYKTENPAGIVIEFDRASRSTIAAKDISAGIRYVKLIKGTEDGPVTVNGLMVDQTLLNVYPYIGQKKEEAPNFFGIFGSLFSFWGGEEQTKYHKDKVSAMVTDADAIAGVNGTFFGYAGEPLGVLMINGELVSYSINDRTALIIDKTNHCFIDNVSLSGETSLEGAIIQLAGINAKRGAGEAVIYTPRYGSQTNEDNPGIVLSVVGDEVRDISRARAWIPKEGYAISLDPTYYNMLGSKVKVGSKIHTTLKLMPLSGLANIEIKHVIGGGPRLLKSGQIYISRNSERFKNDIAKSRAARTAVGINKEGTLVFVTVDKCPPSAKAGKSAGATLEELAQIMKDLGCVDAMNLDGGSSTSMVLNGNLINTPSNGIERSVSNGILISK
jgi:Phosphodiester glycosidase